MSSELQYSNESKKDLAEGFVPSDKDVIVGRGKKCYNHTGNQELRRIVKSKLDEYSASSSKHDKSYILACIISQVRNNGGFVKEDPDTGRWYDVGDSLAREKISQTFRDALENKYKSSTAFKRKRRQEKRAKAAPAATSSNFPIFMPYHTQSMYQQYSAMYNSSMSQSMTVLDLENASNELIIPQKSSLSQSLSVLDLESASDEPISVVERLSSSLPNLWFEQEEEEDPFMPIPVSQAPSMEENCFKPIANDTSFEPLKLPNATSYGSDPIHISDDEGSQVQEPIMVQSSKPLDDPWERSVRKCGDSLVQDNSRTSNINSARTA